MKILHNNMISFFYFSTPILAFISKLLHKDATPPILLGRVTLILTTTPSSSSSMILLLFLDETGVEVSNGLILVTLLLLPLLVLVSLLKSSAPYFSIKSL